MVKWLKIVAVMLGLFVALAIWAANKAEHQQREDVSQPPPTQLIGVCSKG